MDILVVNILVKLYSRRFLDLSVLLLSMVWFLYHGGEFVSFSTGGVVSELCGQLA